MQWLVVKTDQGNPKKGLESALPRPEASVPVLLRLLPLTVMCPVWQARLSIKHPIFTEIWGVEGDFKPQQIVRQCF